MPQSTVINVLANHNNEDNNEDILDSLSYLENYVTLLLPTNKSSAEEKRKNIELIEQVLVCKIPAKEAEGLANKIIEDKPALIWYLKQQNSLSIRNAIKKIINTASAHLFKQMMEYHIDNKPALIWYVESATTNADTATAISAILGSRRTQAAKQIEKIILAGLPSIMWYLTTSQDEEELKKRLIQVVTARIDENNKKHYINAAIKCVGTMDFLGTLKINSHYQKYFTDYCKEIAAIPIESLETRLNNTSKLNQSSVTLFSTSAKRKRKYANNDIDFVCKKK